MAIVLYDSVNIFIDRYSNIETEGGYVQIEQNLEVSFLCECPKFQCHWL